MKEKKKKLENINSRAETVTYDHLSIDEKRSWDELEDLYGKHFDHIMQIANIIKCGSDNQELVNIITNKEEFSILLNGFKKELDSIVTKLFLIHEEHEGKTGPIINGIELRASFAINEKYICLGELITSNLYNISNSIGNILDDTNNILLNNSTNTMSKIN